MKKQLLITALFFSFISVSAQQKKYSQEAIDLNDRATEIMLRNLSNKDSIAEVLNLLDKAIALDQSYITAYGNNKEKYIDNDQIYELTKYKNNTISAIRNILRNDKVFSRSIELEDSIKDKFIYNMECQQKNYLFN